MQFRIRGLDPALFSHLYGLSAAELAEHGAIRYTVDQPGSFPDRIEVRDCAPGETVLLINFTHQPAATPYRASHAIFVREGAERALDTVNTIPPAMASRIISLRAFDAHDMIVEADLAEGAELSARIVGLLARDDVAYIHAHYAKYGCYAARIERA
jgi:hypothetical protein